MIKKSQTQQKISISDGDKAILSYIQSTIIDNITKVQKNLSLVSQSAISDEEKIQQIQNIINDFNLHSAGDIERSIHGLSNSTKVMIQSIIGDKVKQFNKMLK